MEGRVSPRLSRYKAIFFAAYILFLIILAELSIRLLYPIYSLYVRKPNETTFKHTARIHRLKPDFFVPHSYLGYAPRPGYNDGYISIYRKGYFRAEDRIKEDDFNIFFTGGSTAFGAYLDDKSYYIPFLEDILKKRFPQLKINVITAGVGGYSSVQERILIENVILNYRPRIIVMFTGWNDTYYGYRATNILEQETFMDFASKMQGKRGFYNPEFYEYKLKLYWLLSKVYYRYNAARIDQGSVLDRSLDPEYVLDTFSRQIEIISLLAKKYNFTLVVALQPTIYLTAKPLSDDEKRVTEYNKRFYLGFPEYNMKVYRLYRQILPQHLNYLGCIFWDVDAALEGKRDTLFFDHVHFNTEGNKVIANFFAEKLSSVIDCFR